MNCFVSNRSVFAVKVKSFIYGTMGTVLLSAFLTSRALAVGTPAGTIISSRVEVIYKTASGAATDSTFSNYATVTVGQVGAVNITPASSAFTTSTDSTIHDYALTISNSGNGADNIIFATASSKGWTHQIYHDVNGDGVLESGELAGGTISQTGSLAEDATFKIIVRVTVPKDPSLNGQTDTTTVTATSAFDNTKTSDGVLKTTVNAAYFSNIGSGLVVAPNNPGGGQNVTYTFSITNTGLVAATGVTFSDFITSPPFTFVNASSPGALSGNTVSWNMGTIGPGANASVTLTLQVQSGVSNGTVLNNTMNVSYTAGGNTFIITSNNPLAIVGVSRGVSISPTALSATTEPEDTVEYYMTVKNTGNSKDVLEMSLSSSQSYAWKFYDDVNNDGIFESGTDTPLIDHPGTPSGVDVDSVAANDSVHVFAILAAPIVSTDQTVDNTTFTVKSAADGTKSQTATAATTIDIPVVSLNRSITPSGNQPPGTQMTYSITYQNTGHGKAYNFQIVDGPPDSTTYVPGSIQLNGVSKTDASDGDEATVTTVSGKKIITINLGTLSGLSPAGTVQFKITVN
jgi:uncharacterized repeat protein (TIGR01451 family)